MERCAVGPYTNKEGMVGDVKAGCNLGSSDHEIMEFNIMQGRNRAISKIETLNFMKANVSLFRNLLGRIPWEQALEKRGV